MMYKLAFLPEIIGADWHVLMLLMLSLTREVFGVQAYVK